MSRFTVGSPISELRYGTTDPSGSTPDLYLEGDAAQGFDVTAAPPELGFWGVTFHESQINAAMLEPGNIATWLMNNPASLVDADDPEFGENRFVSLGAANIMREAMPEGSLREVDGYRALSNRLSPVQNVNELDTILMFKDEDFNADEAVAEWTANPSNKIKSAAVQRINGRDMADVLKGARNRNHFHFLQMRELQAAKARQNMDNWSEESNIFSNTASYVGSGVFNYILTDPTFAPSVVLPVGGAGKLGQAAGMIGKSVSRVGGATAGKVATALAKSPAAVHTSIANRIGHRAAVAVELASQGAAFDVAVQQQRIQNSEVLWDDPEYQTEFSWAELGLVTGMGAALGFATAGFSKGSYQNLKEVRRASADVAGGGNSSPIAHSLDNLNAQFRVDQAGVRVQRASERLLGDDFNQMAIYLDDEELIKAGLHRFQIADVMERLADNVGEEGLDAVAVHRVMSDLIADARKVSKAKSDAVETFAGNQLESIAFAESLGRAARELPNSANNSAVLKRAQEIMPEELAKQERRIASQAKRARPAAGPEELPFWKAQLQELQDAAARRRLTEAELDHMGTVSGKLQSLGEPDPLAGFAQSRGRRFRDGSTFSTDRVVSGSSLTKAVNRLVGAQDTIKILKANPSTSDSWKKQLKNAQATVRRAKKTIKDQTAKETDRIDTVSTSKVRDVAQRLVADPPKTKAARAAALDEIADAVDFGANALIEDGTMIGKVLQSWGLKQLGDVAQSGTGLNQTARSTLGVLRELVHEFDNSKLRVGSLDPRSQKVYRSLEDIRNDMQVRTSEILGAYQRIHDSGRFGTALKFRTYKNKQKEFDKQVIRHITKTEISTDEDVIKLANLWKKHADDLGKQGEAAGLYKAQSNFFPRRWSPSSIYKNEEGFLAGLSKHFTKQWSETDDVHLDTIVSMGRAKRTDADGVASWTDLEGNALSERMSRADLDKLGVTEEDYLKALVTRGEDGFTPMERAANRVKANLSGEDSYEKASNGRLVTVRHNGPKSERTRELEELVWANKDLEEFLDWDFNGGMSRYFMSSGFRAANTARHQERWGISGLTMQETLDWVETRMTRELNAGRVPLERATGNKAVSAAEKKSWLDGLNNLREKLALAEGRHPTLRSDVDSVQEFVSDTAVSAAGAVYGGGIGQTILATEVVGATVARIYSPSDVISTVGHILKGVRGAEKRQLMEIMGLTVRQFRMHNLKRFVQDESFAGSFEFGLVPRVLAPFADVRWNANIVPDLLKAGANVGMTLGGLDYFSNFARIMHVMSQQNEFGRFFVAAEKLTARLSKAADELDAVAEKASAKALAKGASDEAAVKAGSRARMKAWTGMAREEGFGGNWQVAEKMQRAGLLDADRLAVLRKAGAATNSLKTTGSFRNMDMIEMYRYTGSNRAEQELFHDSFNRVRDMMAGVMNKRVSEQSLMQTPTGATNQGALGRVAYAMTSWQRSWYDNNILDAAQMPLKASVGMYAAYMFGETMNQFIRESYKGRSLEESLEDARANPGNFVARAVTRLPLLGHWSSVLTPTADILFEPENQRYTPKIEVGRSAATGALNSVNNLIVDTVQSAKNGEPLESSSWRTASRFIPFYRSAASTLALHGLSAAGVIDESMVPGATSGGYRRRKYKPNLSNLDIPDSFESNLEVPSNPIPDNIQFLFPE